MSFSDYKPSSYILWGIFTCYAILVLAGAFHHEPWADEAQAWLLVRDNSLAGILRILPTEGHPPLWYLLIFPIVKSGLPYESLKWFTAAIAIAAVYVFMFCSKIHVFIKLLLPFSYMLIFEYAVFGRSYCLVAFFLAVIVALYPQRFERPWLYALVVVGLFNTHILIFSFCFGLAMLFFIDAMQYKKLNGNIFAAIIATFIGGLYLLPYLMQDEMSGHFGKSITDHTKNIEVAITGAILIEGNKALAISLLLVLSLLLAQRPKAMLLGICGIAGVLYILGYKYNGTSRHFVMLFAILLGSYGIAGHYKEDKMNLRGIKQNLTEWGYLVLCVVIIMQAPVTIERYTLDKNYLYSDAKNMAAYIKSKFKKDDIIVAWPATSCLSILPYLPERKLFYAECQRFGTYFIYDTCFRSDRWMNPVDYGVKVAHETFPGQLDKLVFLFDYPVMPQSEKYLDLVYKTPEEVLRWDEAFYIYKFKRGVK
jgi:hypothetical protein